MLVLVGIGQIGIVVFFYKWLEKLIKLRFIQGIIFFAGTRLMTIYLWHMPMIFVSLVLALVRGIPFPTPSSGIWWATRPFVFIAAIFFVYLISLLVGRFEMLGTDIPQRMRRPRPL